MLYPCKSGKLNIAQQYARCYSTKSIAAHNGGFEITIKAAVLLYRRPGGIQEDAVMLHFSP